MHQLKTYLSIILVSLILVSFAGCTKDQPNNNNNNNTNTNNLNKQDSTFITKVAQSNQAELDLGLLAAGKSGDTAIVNFANMMMNDHSQAQADLRSLASNKNVAFADSLDARHKMLKQQLSAMSGRQFDSAYAVNMVMDHQTADSVFAAEQSGGSDADVKNYANKYRPVIQMHLQRAQSIATKYK